MLRSRSLVSRAAERHSHGPQSIADRDRRDAVQRSRGPRASAAPHLQEGRERSGSATVLPNAEASASSVRPWVRVQGVDVPCSANTVSPGCNLKCGIGHFQQRRARGRRRGRHAATVDQLETIRERRGQGEGYTDGNDGCRKLSSDVTGTKDARVVVAPSESDQAAHATPVCPEDAPDAGPVCPEDAPDAGGSSACGTRRAVPDSDSVASIPVAKARRVWPPAARTVDCAVDVKAGVAQLADVAATDSASITFQLHGQTWVAAPVIKHDPRSPPETWAPTRASQALLKHILSTGGAQLLTEEATDRRASLQEVGHLQPDTSSPGSPRGSSLAAASSTPEFLAESRTCRCKEGSSPATISSTLPAESNYSPADDGAAASPADCTFGGEWTFAFEDGFVPDWGGSESDADNSTSASE